MFVLTVAAFYCFFIRSLGASEQNPKGNIFGFIMFRKRLLFRVPLAPDESYDSAMRKRTYAIFTVAICVSMAGVGGKRRLLSGGTELLAISGIVLLALVFISLARLL